MWARMLLICCTPSLQQLMKCILGFVYLCKDALESLHLRELVILGTTFANRHGN